MRHEKPWGALHEPQRAAGILPAEDSEQPCRRDVGSTLGAALSDRFEIRPWVFFRHLSFVIRTSGRSSHRLLRSSDRMKLSNDAHGEPLPASFVGASYSHCSPKNPALAIPPGAREEIGTVISTIAQSGSLGT